MKIFTYQKQFTGPYISLPLNTRQVIITGGMKTMRQFLAIAILSTLPMSAIIAQEAEPVPTQEVEEEEMSDLEYYTWEIASSLIPIVAFALLLFIIIRMSIKRNRPYQKRALEHMDQIEKKYDRIIELLEELTNRRE